MYMELHVFDLVILSDLHLGSEVSRAREALDLLRSISFKRLILLGDIFCDLNFSAIRNILQSLAGRPVVLLGLACWVFAYLPWSTLSDRRPGWSMFWSSERQSRTLYRKLLNPPIEIRPGLSQHSSLNLYRTFAKS